jgi:hypothetical protein
MLEEKMLSTAYPMLLKLMNEYGHSLVIFKLEKSIITHSNTTETLRFEIRSNGKIKVFLPNYTSSSMVDASIGSNAKRCPVLNFLTTSSYVAKGNTYTKYCSEIVSEIEKYKVFEEEASKVSERLDAFNVPLTRKVLIEKTGH